MELFKKGIESSNKLKESRKPEYLTCKKCGREILKELVHTNLSTCAYCGYLFRVPAYERVEMIADADTFVELFAERTSGDPLNFPEYKEKLKKGMKSSSLNEAIICGTCRINGHETALAVMDSFFMMGSMGQIVGEKITDLVDISIAKKIPLIIFCASGGARMQEGMLSLMQMSRTTIAINELADERILYISVLTDPTTGGVTASFAMQGDIILAEPQALIGFAGPRVIKSSSPVNAVFPKGFQTAVIPFIFR